MSVHDMNAMPTGGHLPAPPIAPPLRGAYDCRAAAEYLSISRSELYRLMATGAITYVKIGRLRRVLRSALDRFLADRAAEADLHRFGGSRHEQA